MPKIGQKKRILLVDPHPIFRQGLTEFIQNEPDLSVCGEANTAHEGLSSVASLNPDLAIISLALKLSVGLELIKDLKVHHPSLSILVVSMHDENLYCERVLRAGAKGYIMKNESGPDIIAAIRRVLNGRVYLSQDMGTKLLSPMINGGVSSNGSPVDTLSDRELEVLQLLGNAYETRQIAATLHVSVKTVESYREHIKSKLNLDNSTQLIHRAVQWVLSTGLG